MNKSSSSTSSSSSSQESRQVPHKLKNESEAGLCGYKNLWIFPAAALPLRLTSSPGPPAGREGKTQEERGAYEGINAEKTVCKKTK